MQHLPFFNKKNLVILITAISSSSFAADIQEITITASPLNKNADAVSQANNLLAGDELRKSVASTLGETLQQLPGINSSSFGPGVGIPIIRGQSDNRVKVMQDSIGSMDASASSPDHAIAIEPLLANRIEVLRGPAALRYGSGAIGGVVNVFDNRIPDKLPEDSEGGVELRYGDVNQEQTAVASVTGAVNQFALHWDGVNRRTDDTKIPGYASSEVNPSETTKGFIDNTDSNLESNSLGVSYIGEEGFVGIAINQLDNNYGIPPESASGEKAHIDLQQARVDLKTELKNPFAGFEKVSGRIAFNDYEHKEIVGDEVEALFTNDAHEGRVELIHKPIGNVRGAIGLQFAGRTFAAKEAVEEGADSTQVARGFIPESDIKNTGVFVLEEISFGDWLYEAGARLEKQSIKAETGEDISHKSNNFSASAIWHFTETQRLNLSLARSQRAPSVEELLSDGVHEATQSYLIGDSSLNRETSQNIEMGYHWHSKKLEASINFFNNHIENYIYAAATGEEKEELPVFAYSQADAKFTGYESQFTFFMNDNWQWHFSADKVKARLTSGEDLPRIPPTRFSNSIEYTLNNWNASLSMTKVADQQHPGLNEKPTSGYKRWDARLSYTFDQDQQYLIFLKANNFTNEEIRNASSFLRDIAPEAGRNIQLGVRMKF